MKGSIEVTDEELMRMARNPARIEEARGEAHAAWASARAQQEAPVAEIDAEWREWQARARGAAAVSPNAGPGERDEAAVRSLRLARDAAARFRELAAIPYAHRNQQARELAAGQATAAAEQARQKREADAGAAIKAAGLETDDAGKIIVGLAKRGVSLGIDNGRLVARPRDKVDDVARRLADRHKVALLDALAAREHPAEL